MHLAGALAAAAEMVDETAELERSPPDVFVNATGLGARELVPDEGVFPVKGQTVLVKGEAREARTRDGIRYVIPRTGSGTTVLGTTREVGVWYVLLPFFFIFVRRCRESALEEWKIKR